MLNNDLFPDNYKDFKLLSITDIPDCSSKALYLRHKKLGLEIFHLFNEDPENLFAFAFRTPIKNSTGAAHILEHSVFCGSEKFPLKEPFTNLMNQSVNTFLNALTYSDKTVYPASSLIKPDYFNLMDVYSDAVFFPLLKKEAFMQEGHRIEINDDGEYEIQGVVYNEMKGNYSSFDSVAIDEQLRCVFPDTNYACDSGGDPIEIPDFSYEDFLNFHKKYYKPENCLLFLYGNIPTKEQIDFLDEKVISRLVKKFPQVSEYSEPFPNIAQEYIDIETQKPFPAPLQLVRTAPDAGSTGENVTMNWLCGESTNLQEFIECSFMGEILAGNDSSPLSKALTDSNLGDDLAPGGCFNETRQFSFSIGLHGVKKGNEKKVFKLIRKTLEKCVKKGIKQTDIDAALMCAEFFNREVTRANGPYSLVLLDRALTGWNYGKNPAETMLIRNAFDNLKKKLNENPDYTSKLIKKYLLDNKNITYLTVCPSKNYLEDRAKKENETLKKITQNIDKKQMLEELELLHSYQQHHETEEEISCIPNLKISDLNVKTEHIETKQELFTVNGQEIPYLSNEENTNGIAYIDVLFPVDKLTPEEYKLLPFFAFASTNSGWNGKNWAECAEEEALFTGGISAGALNGSSAKTENSNKLYESLCNKNLFTRDWILFQTKAIQEKLPEAVKLFSECISSFNFKDKKRVKKLLLEAQGNLKAAIIPRGNKYASIRSQCLKNHTCTTDEIWRGITQLYAINALCKENISSICKKLESISQKIKESGAFIHVTGDKLTLEKLKPLVNDFIQGTKLKTLCEKPVLDNEAFKKLTILPGEDGYQLKENFTFSSQVGYASVSFDSSYFGTKENSSELVLSHYLSGTSLWEKIRTTGGAYGASAASYNLAGLFTIYSYRDPTPHKSLETFTECLKESAENLIDEAELYRMITGTYGDEVQPKSPARKGNVGMLRTINCISEDDITAKIEGILSVKAEDIKAQAQNILDSEKSSRKIVLCDKSTKITGVIIELPL